MTYTPAQKTALIIAIVTSFLGPFLISSVNIALPTIEQEMMLNSNELGWIINAFLLTSAIFLLPSGKLADSWGQVRIYRWGILLFTIGTLLCAVSTTGTALIIFRILQGIGAAMTTTTGAALLVSFFPPDQRGKVLGINVAAVYLGLSAGPYIGGLLTTHWGWRSIFYCSAPLGFISIALTFLWLSAEPKSKHQQPFDYKGMALYALFLILLAKGATSLPSLSGTIMLTTALILLPLFMVLEKRISNPIFNLSMFSKNRLFTYSNLAALINYSATFAVVFLLSLYLQKIKLLSPEQAGTLLVIQPIMQVIISPLAGSLSDKFEPRLLATSGMAITTVGLAAMTLFDATTPIWLIAGVLALMGIGFGLFSSPNMNTIMGSVEKHQYGQASGYAATMRVLGQMLSMTIAAFLFSLYFNKISVSAVENTLFISTFRTGFVIFTAISAIGIYFSHFRGGLRTKKPE
jgi:EmrB/QacA subfamily drug resistance transporter